MAKKKKFSLNTKILIVALIILAAVVVLGGTPQTAKFFAANPGANLPSRPGIIAVACCPVSSTPAMSITNVKAITSNGCVDITYTTNHVIGGYMEYKLRGAASSTTRTERCMAGGHEFHICNLAPGTYQYKIKATTTIACAANPGSAETDWLVFII